MSTTEELKRYSGGETSEQVGLLSKKLSFRAYTQGQSLKAGDVLRLKDSSVVLVGDVNAVLGACDDCRLCSEQDTEEVASIFETL